MGPHSCIGGARQIQLRPPGKWGGREGGRDLSEAQSPPPGGGSNSLANTAETQPVLQLHAVFAMAKTGR